jgi:predicted class III extradiol MEMO1 family dioxygenase
MEKIILNGSEENDEIELYVIEETRFNEQDYLLVTDEPDEEAEEADVMVMRRIADEDGTSTYEFVEDEQELSCVFDIFVELIEDLDTDIER